MNLAPPDYAMNTTDMTLEQTLIQHWMFQASYYRYLAEALGDFVVTEADQRIARANAIARMRQDGAVKQ